jgi:hypothetical protein
VVRECGCTPRHLWLAIENQFLGNLDVAFRNFVQGDLSVSEYCRKFKTMDDGLADLGSPIEDRILHPQHSSRVEPTLRARGLHYSALLTIPELSQNSGRPTTVGDPHG